MTSIEPERIFNRATVLERLDEYIAGRNDADIPCLHKNERIYNLHEIRDHIAQGTELGREQTQVWGKALLAKQPTNWPKGNL